MFLRRPTPAAGADGLYFSLCTGRCAMLMHPNTRAIERGKVPSLLLRAPHSAVNLAHRPPLVHREPHLTFAATGQTRKAGRAKAPRYAASSIRPQRKVFC